MSSNAMSDQHLQTWAHATVDFQVAHPTTISTISRICTARFITAKVKADVVIENLFAVVVDVPVAVHLAFASESSCPVGQL